MTRKETLSRLVIYAKDIQLITGKSDRYGRKLIEKIRKHLNKEAHHLVTFHEFCEYTGLHLEYILPFLKFG